MKIYQHTWKKNNTKNNWPCSLPRVEPWIPRSTMFPLPDLQIPTSKTLSWLFCRTLGLAPVTPTLANSISFSPTQHSSTNLPCCYSCSLLQSLLILSTDTYSLLFQNVHILSSPSSPISIALDPEFLQTPEHMLSYSLLAIFYMHPNHPNVHKHLFSVTELNVWNFVIYRYNRKNMFKHYSSWL